jgi:hypothetical protein
MRVLHRKSSHCERKVSFKCLAGSLQSMIYPSRSEKVARVSSIFRIYLKTLLLVLQNVVVAVQMFSAGPWNISWEKYNLRKINGPLQVRCSLFQGYSLAKTFHFVFSIPSASNSFIPLNSPIYESLVQFNLNILTRSRVCHKNIQIIQGLVFPITSLSLRIGIT